MSSFLRPLRLLSRAMSTTPAPAPSTIPGLTAPGSHRDMRRAFYIDSVVDKVMNKSLGHPFMMWTKTRAEWYRILKTERGCRIFLRSRFLNQLRTSIRDDEREWTKRFGSEKVCLARSFSEHQRIKRDLYRFKYMSLAAGARGGPMKNTMGIVVDAQTQTGDELLSAVAKRKEHEKDGKE